ncbi:hypothetical protein GOBAR_DD35576 [Gossypium barbadense]|nr:hypothetical protein GOBAR_DD35576 [Gossypium barbadense]
MFLRRFAVIVPRSTRFFSSKDSLDVASTIAELNKGTAGVALAGLLGTVRAQGRSLDDFPNHKIVVVGAGSYLADL